MNRHREQKRRKRGEKYTEIERDGERCIRMYRETEEEGQMEMK